MARQIAMLVMFLGLLISGTTAQADKKANLTDDKETKLISLENQVSALEGKAFKLERKIKEIARKIFKGDFLVGKTSVEIHHKLEIGGAFRVKELTYILSRFDANGRRISRHYLWKAKGNVANSRRLYRAKADAAKYRVDVMVKFQGHGYGIFKYMEGYKAIMKKHVNFTAVERRINKIILVIKDTGSTKLQKRFKLLIQKKTSG